MRPERIALFPTWGMPAKVDTITSNEGKMLVERESAEKV
jgi:hypothetical protein